MDQINKRMKSEVVKWAAAGRKQPWQTKFGMRARQYTTRWGDFQEVT